MNPAQRPRVAAVSYLNTAPLIHGLTQGPQAGRFQLELCLPSACADRVRAGAADIGLLPVIEMARQGLEYCPGTGIACEGEVRSILLVSKVEPGKIRSLAVDLGSRTSVMLARIVLQRTYGAEPETTASEPELYRMLAANDAALVIGDPALHLDPAALPFHTLDLGAEWQCLTGLPMVFAVWSGASQFTGDENSKLFEESLQFGLQNMETIVVAESAARELPPDLVERYLTRHIRYSLGEREYDGLRTYLQWAAELEPSLPLTTPRLLQVPA